VMRPVAFAIFAIGVRPRIFDLLRHGRREVG